MTTGYIGIWPHCRQPSHWQPCSYFITCPFSKAGHKPIVFWLVGPPAWQATPVVKVVKETSSEGSIGAITRKAKNNWCSISTFDPFKSPTVPRWWTTTTGLKISPSFHFIRDVGATHHCKLYMMSKDSVKKRLEGELGWAYITEFTYQLAGGWLLLVYKNKNAKLQMGGSDQWGNI